MGPRSGFMGWIFVQIFGFISFGFRFRRGKFTDCSGHPHGVLEGQIASSGSALWTYFCEFVC